MGANDLTPQFRELVARYTLPDTKRRRVTRHKDEASEAQTLINREYVSEAYNIVSYSYTFWEYKLIHES